MKSTAKSKIGSTPTATRPCPPYLSSGYANSVPGNSLRSCLNMLQNPLTDEPPVFGGVGRTFSSLDLTIAQRAHPFSRVNLMS